MVVIELFDEDSPIDNILGSLMIKTEKVIFLGANKKKFYVHAQRYQKILSGRGWNTDFEFYSISKNNVDAIVEIFDELIQIYPNCVFDLSGGEDITLVAAGMLQERYSDQSIPMYRINPNSRVITSIYGELPELREDISPLTVREMILLHGGDIVYRSEEHTDGTFLWDFNEEFEQDFSTMWEISRQNLSKWNILMTIFSLLDFCENQSTELYTYTVDRQAFRDLMDRKTHFRHVPEHLIQTLHQNNLITEYRRTEHTLHVAFKNAQVMECLCKAGTVWELKIYRELCALTDKKGVNYYDDCLTGVLIDWDGEIHDESDSNAPDFREPIDVINEIDVIGIRGVTPVFISCKNGNFTQDELFKLSTVAHRFGGKYARKALMASQRKSDTYFQERAREMNIKLSESCLDSDIRSRLRELAP